MNMENQKKEHKEVNFCELSRGEMILILEFLGEKYANIYASEDVSREFNRFECIEERYNDYDTLVIKPKSISIICRPGGETILMTDEQYIKLTNIKQNSNISEQQYADAAKIVEEYNIQKNKSLIKNMTCICCRKNEIKPLAGTGLADGYINPLEQERGCWDDGTVDKVTFGYGSKHDCRTFYIAICDDCLSDLEVNDLVTDLSKLRKK